MVDDSFPLLLRVPECARLLGVSQRKVWQLVSEQQLPAVRIGRSVRVPRSGLLALIEAHGSTTGPQAHTDG